MRLSGLALVVALALGCGGSRAASDNPGGGGESEGPNHISENRGSGVDPASPVSADECDRFTAHVLELNMVEVRAELARKGSPELIPSDEQVAEIREKMAAECLEFPRPVVECGTAAPTLQAFVDCQNLASPAAGKAGPGSSEPGE
jgi:hypothetical protein